MALLKEDGSLDVERINKLPYEEYMDEMGTLSEEQIKEYISKLPLNESNEPMQAVKVNYRMGEDGVDAMELINSLRKRLLDGKQDNH